MCLKFIGPIFLAMIYVTGAAAQSTGYAVQQTSPTYANRAPNNAIYTASPAKTYTNPSAGSDDSNGIYTPLPPATHANPSASGGYNGIYMPPAHNN